MIAAGLERYEVPIDSIEPHPDNYRRGDADGIASSLERFGQLRPVLVQASTSFIVAGTHTWRGARLLGWPTIAAVRADLSDDEARAYLVADNRWADAGENDDQALVALLDQLADEGRLDGTGFSPDDIDDLHALVGAVETTPQVFEGGYADQPEQRERTAASGQMPMREVVFTMPHQAHETFARQIKRLASAYATTGVAQTVREAVRREVEAVER